MIKIKHDNKVVGFKEMTARLSKYCGMCGERITVGQRIYLVLTEENKPIPNCTVHKKCTIPQPPFDKNNPLVWTVGELAKSWKAAQRYRHWWDMG